MAQIKIVERCKGKVEPYGNFNHSASLWRCTYAGRFETSQGALCLRHLRAYVRKGLIPPDEYGLLCSAAGIEPT